MTTYTNQFTVSSGSWTNLGTGPLRIKKLPPAQGIVTIIASDTQPSLSAVGWPLNGDDFNSWSDFNVTTSVWAQLLSTQVGSIQVVAQNMTLGGSSGSTPLSDTILTDDSGTQFLARDNGTAITYITLSGSAYTPSTNIRSVTIAGVVKGATALTVGATYPAGAAIMINCTVSGNVNLTLANNSSLILPVVANPMPYILPFSVLSIATSGTTATATYYNLAQG